MYELTAFLVPSYWSVHLTRSLVKLQQSVDASLASSDASPLSLAVAASNEAPSTSGSSSASTSTTASSTTGSLSSSALLNDDSQGASVFDDDFCTLESTPSFELASIGQQHDAGQVVDELIKLLRVLFEYNLQQHSLTVHCQHTIDNSTPKRAITMAEILATETVCAILALYPSRRHR
jgi:hypothetical protein